MQVLGIGGHCGLTQIHNTAHSARWFGERSLRDRLLLHAGNENTGEACTRQSILYCGRAKRMGTITSCFLPISTHRATRFKQPATAVFWAIFSLLDDTAARARDSDETGLEGHHACRNLRRELLIKCSGCRKSSRLSECVGSDLNRKCFNVQIPLIGMMSIFNMGIIIKNS